MSELDDSFDVTNKRLVRMIQEHEVKGPKMMKGEKALGPDDVPIEMR